MCWWGREFGVCAWSKEFWGIRSNLAPYVTTRPRGVHEGALQQVPQGVGREAQQYIDSCKMGVVVTSDGSLASSKMMAISPAHISQRSTRPAPFRAPTAVSSAMAQGLAR